MSKHVAAKEREARKEKVKKVSEQLSSKRLLGQIITWSARSDSSHKHKDVIAALNAAQLDTKVARELLPRFAFTRACKKLAVETVIDVSRETADFVYFQFTKKAMRNEEWVYTKETEVQLNRVTGDLSCPRKDIQERAQKLLDEAMEARTTSDISKIVQKLFEKNADLFSIRDQGGVYFVPQEHTAFVEKIELFLTALGGSITKFPVPTGIDYGVRSVQETVADALNRMILEHEEAIQQFTVNTRKDTIEHAAEKIRMTKAKIEAYANYLTDKRQELLDSVEKAQDKLRKQVEDLATTRATAPEGSGGLFGHSVTAVIRWMGKQNWDFTEAKAALSSKKLQIADATIRAQLLAGRNGTRGEPADLTKSQIKELEEARQAA